MYLRQVESRYATPNNNCSDSGVMGRPTDEHFTTLTARIPVELRDQIEQLAAQRDRSMSAELRIAVRSHLDHARDADFLGESAYSALGRRDQGRGPSVRPSVHQRLNG